MAGGVRPARPGGESAIWIWAPIITKQCPECENSTSYHDDSDCDYDGTPPETWSEGLVGFKPAPVFDVSQSEGEPLPDLDTEATGDAGDLVGQLLSGEGKKTDFSGETVESEEAETTEQEDLERKNAEAAEATDEKPAGETVTFDVDLHCGGCEDRVTEALNEQDGSSEVDTDADEQRVAVTFNPHKISAEDLRDTISDLGYTVTVVDAPTPAD